MCIVINEHELHEANHVNFYIFYIYKCNESDNI